MPIISAVPGLPALGWDDSWMSALAELGDPTLWAGRVSRVDRGVCSVMTGSAEVRLPVERDVEMAVGDWVALGPGPVLGGAPRIRAVLPRRCVFRRAAASGGAPPQIVAANIDTVFICDALDGTLSLRHLERFLVLAWQSGATPVVVVTKADAVTPDTLAEAVQAVRAIAHGVSVVAVSSTTGGGIEALAPYLVPSRTVALLGLSGAGKSTLVNLLAGADVLATGQVRRDGRGRHTTTHRELVLLPGGGLLIDTPGMRALSITGAGEGVEQAFDDLEALAGSCKYTSCSHTGEEGCALAATVVEGRLSAERLESWLRLRTDPQAPDHDGARRAVEQRKRRKALKLLARRERRT